MIVAFTGHRPNKLPGGYDRNSVYHQRIREAIRKKLLLLSPTKCISGMALGIDQLAADLCIEMKIPFIAAIPFKGQETCWPRHSQDHYHYLLSQACEIVTVCAGSYESWKMQKRNEWMVDHCDTLIAVYDGTKGGTGNCVRYARRKDRGLIVLDPSIVAFPECCGMIECCDKCGLCDRCKPYGEHICVG